MGSGELANKWPEDISDEVIIDSGDDKLPDPLQGAFLYLILGLSHVEVIQKYCDNDGEAFACSPDHNCSKHCVQKERACERYAA